MQYEPFADYLHLEHEGLTRSPFRVDMHFLTDPIFYDMPTLDGLLVYCIVQIATAGKGVPETPDPYYIPLPLEKLWTDPDTEAPLWNATRFFPMDTNETETVHWHKRGYRPHLLPTRRDGTPHNANFQNGVHKEYRMPVPLHKCRHYQAYGSGGFSLIAKYLQNLTGVGKKRTQGYGVVEKITVTPVSEVPTHRDQRLLKTYPVAYPEASEIVFGGDGIACDVYETAWTPPYWLPTLFKPCFV